MIIYVDVLFLNNTLMTFAIIWAVSHILNYKSSWWKLLIAAIFGTIYSFIIIYFKFISWPFGLKVIFHLTLNLLTALTMVYLAFGIRPKKQICRAVGYLYLVSFIVIGTILSLFYIYGVTPFYVE